MFPAHPMILEKFHRTPRAASGTGQECDMTACGSGISMIRRITSFSPFYKQSLILLPLLFVPKVLRHKIVDHEHRACGSMNHLNNLPFAKIGDKVLSFESPTQLRHASMSIAM